ncbi:isocitrate lyase/PEP mutase family protein [Aliikangiella coralliicola]|uniref:Isocitrate lyase/phosphoenolpyruvate mutase family protein n=1 Tax=Aliikangiella coralliicola TaxID=2592383 RepID=A0A545UHD1_9GAMM|nr:isocitrate lyase/phosphoenolpyruvate mutase family protein [Aliikangiella coralliicola]TQV88823.1 isocitrate lyase/phosphoenolpyruvate mutase family protein [Aliikangiella coralliicola]
MNFRDLHHQNSPLILCNAWDVASANIAEELGFKAIGTSSAAIASVLGYPDGESISFSELRHFVERIVKNINLPLTVDIESGFSDDPLSVVKNIKLLADMGVVGVNIEDSVVKAEERKLVNAETFSKTISKIREQLEHHQIDIFLNVRTDVFLLGQSNPVNETNKRVDLYSNAGADGIFIPCIEKEDDIEKVVSNTRLPVNVMCMPNLPSFKRLQELGVKRVSMGNFLFEHMYTGFKDTLKAVSDNESFASVF